LSIIEILCKGLRSLNSSCAKDVPRLDAETLTILGRRKLKSRYGVTP